MGDKLRKVYIVLAIVAGVIGLTVMVLVCGAMISLNKQVPLPRDAKDTMYRAAVLTGAEDSLPVWETEIEQGHLSVSD